jgi:toxin ParE1/3/4
MTPARYTVAPAARGDLEEIWFHIAQDNQSAADRLIDTLYAKFQALAATPGIGRRREELLPGVRSLAVGNYVIFYRPAKLRIEVVRVLHGARDIGAQFSGGE